jgi:hypothetical protein
MVLRMRRGAGGEKTAYGEARPRNPVAKR